jgi:hypothetical protein
MATAQAPTRATVPQFAAWALAGTCLAGVLLVAFTVFSYVALVVGVALVLLALRLRGANRSALGLLVGVAAASFYVGWLNGAVRATRAPPTRSARAASRRSRPGRGWEPVSCSWRSP